MVPFDAAFGLADGSGGWTIKTGTDIGYFLIMSTTV
jgi:hypothetical protein